MTEEAHVSESLNKDSNDSAWAYDNDEIQSKIKTAMRSRIPYFRKESDSLTFEGVRRLLERDLELEEFSLDVHKRYIKECLVECLDGADDDNTSKNSGETGETNVSSARGETVESPDGRKSKKLIKEPGSEEEEKMEDSPVLGLLTGYKTNKSETKDTQSVNDKEVLSESTIKKAIGKRASYVKQNLEKVTMAGLRRVLEEDLKLEKHTLDPYKEFISKQLDEVLESLEVSESLTMVKKKNIKKSNSKASKRVSSEESSESSDNQSDEEEDEVKPKKKVVSKRKKQGFEELKKRKKPEKESKASGKKRIKHKETKSEDNIHDKDGVVDSEDDNSQSSAEKPVKKKEVPTLAFGKRVEHLKSVIKACGMSVPPSIYKKVKQAPEEKREARLIKELEEILSKEGLSSNPSEKEIKEVRKRKERAKELEGIDTSNIISSSRRRSSTSFVVPPKPQKPDGSDADDTEDSDDNDDDEENDDNDKGNDADGGDDGSESEGPNEDDEDSD